MANSLPPRPSPRRSMKLQRGIASDELHLRIGLMQQSSEVERRSAASDYDHAASSKRLEMGMTVAMRQKLGRQMRQVGRHVLEIRDADGEHDPPSRTHFTIAKPKQERPRRIHVVNNEHVCP